MPLPQTTLLPATGLHGEKGPHGPYLLHQVQRPVPVVVARQHVGRLEITVTHFNPLFLWGHAGLKKPEWSLKHSKVTCMWGRPDPTQWLDLEWYRVQILFFLTNSKNIHRYIQVVAHFDFIHLLFII